MGVSGLSIIEAILSGERDAEKLTALCNKQILKEKKEKVQQSLKGNFKREYIFMMLILVKNIRITSYNVCYTKLLRIENSRE